MIIVSGEPRSGTSLMMETVRLLGVEVWGEEQPGEKRREEMREKSGKEETFEEKLQAEKAKDMNEKFWEIGGLVMKGFKPFSMARGKHDIKYNVLLSDEEKKHKLKAIDDVIEQYEKHKDHAVKIIWNGVMKTDPEVLESSKIILCLRDPLHIAKSQQRLEGNTKVAAIVDGKEVFVSAEQPLSPMRYLNSASQFIRWLQHPENKNYDILKIVYDDMQFKTEETINKIAKFIETNPTKDQINTAIENIDPNKRRSADIKMPEENKDEWVLVREIFEALVDEEYELINRRVADYQEFQKTNPANAKWFDEDTFFPIDVDLYRSMLKKPKLKNNMIKSKKQREAIGILCTSCPLFNKDGEEYEIELPSDLENIKRNKIKCKELVAEVTLEQCQNHWQSIEHDKNRLKVLNNEESKPTVGNSKVSHFKA
jgi:hypothetical protein